MSKTTPDIREMTGISEEYFVFRTSMWEIPADFGDCSGVGGSLANLLSSTEFQHLCHAPEPRCGCPGADKGIPSKLPWKDDSSSQRLFSAMNRNRHRASRRLIEVIRQQTHKGSVSSKQLRFQPAGGEIAKQCEKV